MKTSSPTVVIDRSHVKEALQLRHVGSLFHHYRAGMLIKGAISLMLAVAVLNANLAQPSHMHIGSMDLSEPFKGVLVTFASIASFLLGYGFLTMLSRKARRQTIHEAADKWAAKTGGNMHLRLVEDKFFLTYADGRAESIPINSLIRMIESPAMVIFIMTSGVIPLPKQGDWQRMVDQIKDQQSVKAVTIDRLPP